jgi:glycosyltransferase involved in cell wall biosynthesis
MTKLSIITINRNYASGLQKTIQSVLSQSFLDYEYIVIDGASTDESAALLRKYREKFVYCVSELDNGVYDAMNKGILVATGEYCLFLNSGDYLENPNSLKELFLYHFSEDIVYGDTFVKRKDGVIRQEKAPAILSIATPALNHQSCLIKTICLKNNGCYRTDFKILSDFFFWKKMLFLENASYKHIPFAFSVFEFGGISSNPKYCEIRDEEYRKVYAELFPNMSKDISELQMLHTLQKVPGFKLMISLPYKLILKIKIISSKMRGIV